MIINHLLNCNVQDEASSNRFVDHLPCAVAFLCHRDPTESENNLWNTYITVFHRHRKRTRRIGRSFFVCTSSISLLLLLFNRRRRKKYIDVEHMSPHIVYCLRRTKPDGKRTYVGYTMNLKRRLRQHNGEIAGGAKSTRGAQWEVMFYVSGFPSKKIALSCEKRFHLLRTRNRPAGLAKILNMERWKRTNKPDIIPSTLNLTIHCDDPNVFKNLYLPANVVILKESINCASS
jgi:predicted GIY-YIG superfamily endonuclease